MERLTNIQIATSRSVVRRAFRIATIVGIVLAAINHGDRIISGDLDLNALIKIALTFLVPYTVSTVSSVLAVRDQEQLIARESE